MDTIKRYKEISEKMQSKYAVVEVITANNNNNNNINLNNT